MCCTIFLNEKTPFEAIKTRSLNIWKIEIFPKRLTDGFGQKLPIFPFLGGQYWSGECVLRHCRTEKTPS